MIEVHNYFGDINKIFEKLTDSGFDVVYGFNSVIKFEIKDSITILKCTRNNR